jgi:hypothetical protein
LAESLAAEVGARNELLQQYAMLVSCVETRERLGLSLGSAAGMVGGAALGGLRDGPWLRRTALGDFTAAEGQAAADAPNPPTTEGSAASLKELAAMPVPDDARLLARRLVMLLSAIPLSAQ